MLALLLASNLPAQETTVQITNVDRHQTTLGRRGDRVTESWTVKVNGQTATINFAPYHTRLANTPKFRNEGESVDLSITQSQSKTLTAGGNLHLTISAVKN